jgi:hypothetical protein
VLDDALPAVLKVSFVPRHELRQPMRDEVDAGGWEVAGPQAYPRLMVRGTPAGGISPAEREDLIAIVAAIPPFVAAHPELVQSGDLFPDPLRWTEPKTGVEFWYYGEFETGSRGRQ